MTSRVRLYPYRAASVSARLLASVLGILRIRSGNTRFRTRPSDIIINWGSTELDVDLPERLYNNPTNILVASNKLLFFSKSADCDLYKTPAYTTDPDAAIRWPTCVSRLLVNASGGRGIVLTSKGQPPPDAPLYVKYVKKNKEFRIHVAFGEIIDEQRKIRDPDRDPIEWRIRNHANGFIFARESGLPTDRSREAALACVTHLGLDFGAVDLIETANGHTFILEVNTAPGLEGTTLENYRVAFRKKIDEDRS